MSRFDKECSKAVLLMEKRLTQLQRELVDSKAQQSQQATVLLDLEEQHAKQLRNAQVSCRRATCGLYVQLLVLPCYNHLCFTVTSVC
jgi:hypothetical protein